MRSLETQPARLLGAGTASPRTHQEVILQPGDTVLLYTDGLVQNRRTGKDGGIARLTLELGELSDLPDEELCDELLEQLIPVAPTTSTARLYLRNRLSYTLKRNSTTSPSCMT